MCVCEPLELDQYGDFYDGIMYCMLFIDQKTILYRVECFAINKRLFNWK